MDNETSKQKLIENMALLQVIEHHKHEFKDRPLHINTPHGTAISKEWGSAYRLEISTDIYPDERQYAVEIAHDRLIRKVTNDLTIALAGQQITDMVYVPKRYREERDWMLLCSDETFYRFAESEMAMFNPVAQRYIYDGLPLLRHNLPTDIFIHTKQSRVINFECAFRTEKIDETPDKTTWEYRLYVRGYWLIISDTAQPL